MYFSQTQKSTFRAKSLTANYKKVNFAHLGMIDIIHNPASYKRGGRQEGTVNRTSTDKLGHETLHIYVEQKRGKENVVKLGKNILKHRLKNLDSTHTSF